MSGRVTYHGEELVQRISLKRAVSYGFKDRTRIQMYGVGNLRPKGQGCLDVATCYFDYYETAIRSRAHYPSGAMTFSVIEGLELSCVARRLL